jgi:type I restriction enzyme, S subunit
MGVKPGYKRTDVGLIPEDWKVARLSGVCSMKSGEGITSATIDQFSRYPCYGGNGLRGFTTNFTHDGSYALVGRQGALCGNVLGVDGRFFASEHAIVVTALAETDIRWLTFVLDQMRLNRYSESSAQPGLSVAKLLTLELALPPTSLEQEAIAGALRDVDALIESIEQLLTKKHQLKQGAMQELLTGKKRLPDFSGEWEVKRLGDLLTIAHGKSQFAVVDENGAYPILATGGQIGTANRFLYDKPSVLIGRKGTIDLPRFMDTPFWTVDTLFYSIVHEPNDAKFLYYRFWLIDWKQHNEASGVPSLNARTIEKIEIATPQRQEQAAIATVLSDMDSEIDALEAKAAKARALKQGMMQQLLTGNIRLV